MSVFHKLALRDLRKNRARTIVTIVGVALSAALVTGAVTFGLSLLDYAAAGAMRKYGDWHVAFLDVDAAFADARAHDGEVADAFTTESVGYAPLMGGQNPDKPYLHIESFDMAAFDALPITLIAGRLPENSGELLVPTHVATNGGVTFALGETLALSVGSRGAGGRRLTQHDPYAAGESFAPEREQVYTVVGSYVRPAFEEYAAPGYTVITKTDAKTEADGLNLFVTLQNPRRARAYAAGAAGERACMLNSDVLRFMGLSDDPTDNLFNALLYAIGGVVIAIIMTGSVFLIYNAFGISLSERMRQIGMLASVGATARQIRNSVLFEGLCIGVVGIPAGVCLGLLGVRIVIAVVAQNFYSIMYSGVPLTLHVSVLAIAVATAISMATILISAYIPAKKAASTPVMACIRQTNEVKLEPGAARTSELTWRVCGLPGTLALKNFRRNGKRYRSIVLSLALSVVLFIATSAFVADIRQLMAQASTFTTYDIGFGTQTMDDKEMLALYDRLRTARGVTESGYQSVATYFCSVPADALSAGYWEAVGEAPADGAVELPMEVQFLDDDTFFDILADLGLSPEAYAGENARMLAVAKLGMGDGEKKGVREVRDFRDLFTRPAVEISLLPSVRGEPNRERAYSVGMTAVELVAPDIPPTRETSAYTEQDVYILMALAPWSLLKARNADGVSADLRVKGMTFSSENPAQSVADMQATLRNAGVTDAYMLFNADDVLEENRNYVFIANVFAYTFIVMISLIAVANVFNTVSTNIRLRRRELAMLRSVGMSDRDFDAMMRFECAFYGMRALLLGLPIAVVCSFAIHKGMSMGGADGIVFSLPWGSVGVSVVSVLLVIFVAMMYAVGRIRKENIIDALRDDLA